MTEDTGSTTPGNSGELPAGVIECRKKNPAVEAIQWTGENLGAMQAFCGRLGWGDEAFCAASGREDRPGMVWSDVQHGYLGNDLSRAESDWRRHQAEQALPWELKQRLELLVEVEKTLGMKLDKWGGWPAIPPTNITPAELVMLLGDAVAHVTAQRRAEQAEKARLALQKAATIALAEAKRIQPEGDGS
jgi:hypothetical protein